jgi:Kef-type K+ transport system membrane component KefB
VIGTGSRGPLPGIGVSVLLVVVAVATFVMVTAIGPSTPAPGVGQPVHPAAAVASDPSILPSVLLAWVVVILTARAVGSVFSWLHQPPVMGEVIAGILLGPSLLGQLAPGAFASVFEPRALPVLAGLSQLGIVLFMFLVGMELDPVLLKRRRDSALTISVASMTVAFAGGLALAWFLYPHLSNPEVPFRVFALFLGVALSVTAFPVLVRILTDRGLIGTELGTLAVSCAAVDDLAAWCLLAFVSSARAASFGAAWVTVATATAYVVVMLVAVRPLVHTLVRRYDGRGAPSPSLFALMVVLMLLSALATERIGIHAVFGAFLAGAVAPHDSRFAREVARKLQEFLVVLFLPLFFALTGLRTQLGLLHGTGPWLLCLVITLVACLGKFGGTFLASRLTGLSWRQAAALGVLLNTRGLMELIVLNVGLEQGVISETLFTMLVVMAVLTTVATTPVLDALGGASSLQTQRLGAVSPVSTVREAFR